MSNRHILLLKILLIIFSTSNAQPASSNNKENIPPKTIEAYRWWNLLHYTIDITPDYDTKFISGTNAIKFRALETGKTLQLDLQQPMSITSITWKNSPVPFKKDKETYLVIFPGPITRGATETITVHFEGHPQSAKKPPFDNGWIWAKDKKGRPWMSLACEGSGASIWLPCKDVYYDEPDEGVTFSITVPATLKAIANGRMLKRTNNKNGSGTTTWNVTNPINNYNIVPYIGTYVTWHKNYAGKKGNLDCDYWVIDYNLDKAKKHLRQTDSMLQCFEYWLGAYPFYEDSYKLVEAPMPGMEHQSGIAYGNNFENGYSLGDISGTGWGLKWDFILIHESGHEWFGNSITSNSHRDSWIHEGFTKYLETIYTGYQFGRQAGNEYANGTWKKIKNDEPILGGSTSDTYYKASAMLHTIRQVVGDTMFRNWLTGLNRELFHRTVNTEEILSILNHHTNKDFSKVFEQYLETTQVPTLEYFFQNKILKYRWTNCVDGFELPVKVSFDNVSYSFIYPTGKWQEVSVDQPVPGVLLVDKNFYVKSRIGG